MYSQTAILLKYKSTNFWTTFLQLGVYNLITSPIKSSSSYLAKSKRFLRSNIARSIATKNWSRTLSGRSFWPFGRFEVGRKWKLIVSEIMPFVLPIVNLEHSYCFVIAKPWPPIVKLLVILKTVILCAF